LLPVATKLEMLGSWSFRRWSKKDTDATVHSLCGDQVGARKSYNPKNKDPKNQGKKSYRPIRTLIAGAREWAMGDLENGDRPTGK
jgi:hypothetical protein